MKRSVSFLLMIIILITSTPALAKENEMRAVWFSYEDYASQLSSLSESDFRQKADEICKNIKSNGMNTIIFHVRAFSDAFYNSSYFGYSRYVSGTAGVSPGYDPLYIMCDIAHENGLDIHAWINPYRIGSPKNVTESSIAYNWYHTYGKERICEVNGLWYYNPASKEVRGYITEGVREIVQNYEVDGIHFDDYFYPTAVESFDIEFYQASGTELSLNEWRLENVNLLIKDTYDSIKKINPNIAFGISPNADIEKNYTNYFADVRKWCSEEGYVDYIVPQIYFAYKNSTMPFDKVLSKWEEICIVPELYIGIASYKSGKEDKWAGEGKYEWMEETDICSRQIKDIRKNQKAKGFMLFSYTPVFSESANESAKAELSNIKNLLETRENTSILESFSLMIKALLGL